jgi:AraC family transcriptional regulator of adaptative response / DNA-3-methyladenine glycosylase II
VRAILGQQVSVRAATTLAGRLAAMFGSRMASSGNLEVLFPTPVQLANAPIERAGVMPARAATVRALARQVADKAIVLSPDVDAQAAVEALRSLPGIGEWTAQYIAMRALREPDAFPADDVALRRALGDGSASRPSPRDLIAQAERWRPWRAYAAQHLWTALASRDGGLEIEPAATA